MQQQSYCHQISCGYVEPLVLYQ